MYLYRRCPAMPGKNCRRDACLFIIFRRGLSVFRSVHHYFSRLLSLFAVMLNFSNSFLCTAHCLYSIIPGICRRTRSICGRNPAGNKSKHACLFYFDSVSVLPENVFRYQPANSCPYRNTACSATGNYSIVLVLLLSVAWFTYETLHSWCCNKNIAVTGKRSCAFMKPAQPGACLYG